MFELPGLDGASSGPRAIVRVLQVLGHLAQHPQGCSLAQLCQALKVPKTSLFVMLKTLQSSGHLMLEQGLYKLGAPSIALGAQMADSARSNFPQCAHEQLQNLSRRTGETSFLAVLTEDGLHCRYLSVVESGNWLRFSVQPDSLKPAFATGTGHAMLAYLPKTDLQAILSRVQFEKITTKTVSSQRSLLNALAKVRREQVSTTDSGTVAQVMSVAAPIFNANGRVMAAVSAGGPTVRMAPQLGAIVRLVRNTAEEISNSVGWLGPWPPEP